MNYTYEIVPYGYGPNNNLIEYVDGQKNKVWFLRDLGKDTNVGRWLNTQDGAQRAIKWMEEHPEEFI